MEAGDRRFDPHPPDSQNSYPGANIKTDQFIQTYTGKRFNALCIHPETDICIEDIAHALALTNRFTGHTKEPYSVAQHSILVSGCCSAENRLWGLLHDAPEAYFADICRPIKQHLNQATNGLLKDMEDYIMEAVCFKFHLPLEEPAEVKRADDNVLANEAFSFFGDTDNYQHWHHRFENGYERFDYMITPRVWREAERLFLSYFEAVSHPGGK